MLGGEERKVKVSDADSSDEELQELFRLATNLVEEEHPKITSEAIVAEAETGESSRPLNEIRPRAEDLRRKRGMKTAILTVTRAGSILMLFLALGLLQQDPPLYVFFVTVAYIFFVIVACLVLGISTFSERRD